MMVRAGTGWQYLLADLSLILFMVTAAALAQSVDKQKAATVSPQAEPLAFYRVASGAPPLGEWLRDQSFDARQQLTIVSQYAAGHQAEAVKRAETLAEQAGEAGAKARIIVEPGPGGTTATLAYDMLEAPMARDLLNTGRDSSDPKERP